MTKRTGGKIGRPGKATDIGSLKDILVQMSTKKNKDGKTYHEAVCRTLLKCAVEGKEAWAIREYLDRVLGKSLQQSQQDITSGGESLNASVSFVGASPIVNSLPIADTGAEDTIQAIEPTSDTLVSDTSASGQKDTSADCT
jgi:hypothetical protein